MVNRVIIVGGKRLQERPDEVEIKRMGDWRLVECTGYSTAGWTKGTGIFPAYIAISATG